VVKVPMFFITVRHQNKLEWGAVKQIGKKCH